MDGDVILDVGAGVGTESLTFARLAGATGRVLAIEANPATFALLARTVPLNDLRQVEVIQAAAMDSTEPMTVSDLGPELTHVNKVGIAGITVPAVTITDLMEDRGVEQIDFLKMNIETKRQPPLAAPGIA